MQAAIPLALLLTSVIITTAAPVKDDSVSSPSTLQSYNGWNSQGCYVDAVDSRKLPVTMATTGGPSAMTVELCLSACLSAGYHVAGLEWSQECYCGSAIPPEQATDGRCDMTCNGNSLEYCGGSLGLNVYTYTAAAASGPTTVQSYSSWTYSNCYVDDVGNRVLPVTMDVPGGAAAMTVELCLDACHSAGYSFAGVEWSQECYCGNSLPTDIARDGRCSMTCNGNTQEVCGGGLGLTVYQDSTVTVTSPVTTYKSWTFSNCYEDSVSNRVLPNAMYVAGGMTIDGCLDACDAAGYEYAGLEYAQECYCGRTFSGTVATDGRCSMTCTGNGAETCGGPNGLDVYQSSTVQPAADNLQSYNGWLFSGCYEDSVSNRVLRLSTLADQGASMTIRTCLNACGALGYIYAGLEYSQECYCGSSLPPVPATDGRCNMPCKGNSLELCGGGNGIDVYKYSTSSTNGSPASTSPTSTFPTTTSFTTAYTTTTYSAATFTTMTTIVEPVTGTTTYGGPVTVTTTYVAPATITTTYGAPVTLTTTVAVPLTTAATVTETVVGSTTIAASLTTVTSIPNVLVQTTTSTQFVPITTSRASLVITGTTWVITNIQKTTATSWYQGAWFPLTTTSVHPVTETITSTSYDVEPLVEPTSVVTQVNVLSYETDYYTTTSYDVEPFTSTATTLEFIPTATTVVTDYTTTSYTVGPYTTTGFDAQATTYTTVIAAPVTVTTTVVTQI